VTTRFPTRDSAKAGEHESTEVQGWGSQGVTSPPGQPAKLWQPHPDLQVRVSWREGTLQVPEHRGIQVILLCGHW
jgi:hypothetical protein